MPSNGVPQGSVLSPVFFTVYTQPLADIVRKHNMKFHLYTDETQLHLLFDDCSRVSKSAAIAKMEACIDEIKSLMLLNMLKLNNSKTEFLQFPPRPHDSTPSITTIRIGSDSITPDLSTKNLVVVLDNDLTLTEHIAATCKAANFQ